MKIAADSLKPSVDSEPVIEGTMYRAPTSRAVIATFPAERAQRSQAAQSSWRLRDPEWTGRAASLTRKEKSGRVAAALRKIRDLPDPDSTKWYSEIEEQSLRCWSWQAN